MTSEDFKNQYLQEWVPSSIKPQETRVGSGYLSYCPYCKRDMNLDFEPAFKLSGQDADNHVDRCLKGGRRYRINPQTAGEEA